MSKYKVGDVLRVRSDSTYMCVNELVVIVDIEDGTMLYKYLTGSNKGRHVRKYSVTVENNTYFCLRYLLKRMLD